MKKIKLFLLLFLLHLSIIGMAQEKKTFTLNDLLPGGNTYRTSTPQTIFTTWWGEICVETDVEQCATIDPRSGKRKALFTLDQLNEWLDSGDKPTVRSCLYTEFPYADKPLAVISVASRRYMVDFKEGKMLWKQEIPSNSSHVDWCPASKSVAYNKDNNLYVMDADGHETAITNDGSNDIVYGQSVHRDEFGIYKGTFWSPDGNRLAFYRMDQSMVPDYPQVDITTRIATTYSCKYPMAGEAMHKVTVGIFCPATKETVWLKAGDPTDRYFTNISWSPDSKKVYMIEVNREQNEARLMRYDALTGELEACLYTERHPKYVEPLHPIQFLPWDGQKFIYQSQRDGYNHLYLFDLSKAGKDGWQHIEGRDGEWQENVKVTQLTSGQWVVRDMAGFDVKNKSVIITANTLSPIQANIFSIKVSNGKRNLIGNDEGVHYVRLSSKGSYLTDTYSSPSVARSINILKASDGRGINLITADDPWKDYDVPEITCGSIKAADGVTDLYYRMVKPVGFDPSKKYPTIVYVYGGPHAHNVEASRNYLSRGWEIYMAQKGYLLFILDNRGSELRGADFENVTFRHLGIEEMKDQMEGVKFLHSLPYVDKDRMGVHGWSFGGFMTINLMLTYPDVFKVGVAGGPVVDWKYYEVMYGERYMDRPQDNPEGYQGSSLLPKVGNLKGKLQIINGYNDPVCVPQHTLSFLRACIDAGKQVDYFTYPGDGHNMFGQDQVHLHERITQYFEDYLK